MRAGSWIDFYPGAGYVIGLGVCNTVFCKLCNTSPNSFLRKRGRD